MHINYQGEIKSIRKELSHSLGNRSAVVDILKKFTSSERINLFFYDKEKKMFFDEHRSSTIALSFLEGDTVSIIGNTYKSKKPYFCPYIPFDANYNVALDNPFKLKITSQIIIPFVVEDQVLGLIRFSKREKTFEKETMGMILELHGVLTDFVLHSICEVDNETYTDFFKLPTSQVYDYLESIKNTFKLLTKNTENPEIKKLIHKAKRHIESIDNYIDSAVVQTTPLSVEIPQEGLKVLIADDVKMNVQILGAMVKQEGITNLHYAYDGDETFDKISQLQSNGGGVDLIFLDHYMPGKLGLEIARAIRKEEKKHNKRRTFVVSITNDPKAIEDEKHLFDYHLPKPFVKADIKNVMSKIKKGL